MYLLYNIAIHIVGFLLRLIAIFNKKIKLFVNGRKAVLQELDLYFSDKDEVIWFHAASLGEFEQGRPIIEKCKKQFPNVKILVTFFSPSGYEIRKGYSIADKVCYLPLDTKKNARKFLEIVNPKIAVFIKYEFWPNILSQLKARNIKTILVSGNFRKDQPFFKWYGAWMKKSLQAFDHFFVQNEASKKLMQQIDLNNVTVNGDTRFDRVYDITKQDINLEYIKRFVDHKLTLIAGSTWPKDEEILLGYINNYSNLNQRFIIAPHTINAKEMEELKHRIHKKTILFSEIRDAELADFQVLIVDSIGILSKVYKYADIAYVGGGFGTGIHNILEPATFAVPIVIGPNYHKFNEAKELVELGACTVIHNVSDLNSDLTELVHNELKRKEKAAIAGAYVLNNTGATEIVMNYLGNIISEK